MESLRFDDLSVVCSFLTVKEFIRFGRTCHKAWHACQDRTDWVWRDLALKRWLFCKVTRYANWKDLYTRRHHIEAHMQKADKFKMIPCRGHQAYITAFLVYGDAIYTG